MQHLQVTVEMSLFYASAIHLTTCQCTKQGTQYWIGINFFRGFLLSKVGVPCVEIWYPGCDCQDEGSTMTQRGVPRRILSKLHTAFQSEKKNIIFHANQRDLFNGSFFQVKEETCRIPTMSWQQKNYCIFVTFLRCLVAGVSRTGGFTRRWGVFCMLLLRDNRGSRQRQ